MLQLLTLALMILTKVGSHTYGGYAPSTNAHGLAYGHGHAPANTLSYGHDHLGSAKAGWVRVAGHTQPSSADKRQALTVVKFHVLDEKVFLPILLDNVRDARKAPGCLFADLVKNADEKASDNYALIEIFRTQEEGDRYGNTTLVQGILALQREGKTGLDQSKGRNGAEQTDYITLAADADKPKKNYV